MSVANYDRSKRAFASLVRSVLPELPQWQAYPCRVVVQNADGSLDLKPDDPAVPGLQAVPLLLPFPNCKVQVLPGARVVLSFLGGDPSQPVAQLWQSGTSPKVVVTATSFIITGTNVQLGGPTAVEPIAKGTSAATLEATFDTAAAAADASLTAACTAATSALSTITSAPAPTIADGKACATATASLVTALAAFAAAMSAASAARSAGRAATLSAVSKTL